MTATKENQRFSITLSADVRAWLKVQAEREGRSLASMANQIIKQAKEATEQKQATA